MEIFLIHSLDLSGSVIWRLPRCKGALGSLPTQAMAPCTQMRHFLIHTTWQGFPCPASSQTSNTLQLCREKPKKCLSWCQLRAIDANGLVLLNTSWWSPSFPFLPSQQIFWCSIYKISTEKVDLVQQVLWHWFMSVTRRYKSITIGL